MKQTNLFQQKTSLAYGGTLLRTRRGRATPRPLSTRATMHLVLRSSQAIGPQSFRRPANARRVQELTARFARKNGVRILSLANAGNHIHLHVKLSSRHTYAAFIRGLTAAVAMAISGASRWKKLPHKFWDYRPFSRVVRGRRGFLAVRDYVAINQLEAAGASRLEARFTLAWREAKRFDRGRQFSRANPT